MSSTREMSRPATGLGTDGVIATSLAAHGPDGIATRVTGWSGRLPWCFRFGMVAAEGPFIAGPPVPESCVAGEVAATYRAVSSLDDPPPEPPSILAIPTTRRAAMPRTISQRTQ